MALASSALVFVLRLRAWASEIVALAQELLPTVALAARVEALLNGHPQLRTARNGIFHIGAFLIGSTFVDEHVTFTKAELVKSDVYRDRLLVPEITDLVDLCDALRLSLAQRKALFQCFRHLDFMRRAGVTRTELLRYCDLRTTKLSCFLLPECPDGATHRSGMTQRWDILQWFAVCFSLCTLDVDKVRTLTRLLSGELNLFVSSHFDALTHNDGGLRFVVSSCRSRSPRRVGRSHPRRCLQRSCMSQSSQTPRRRRMQLRLLLTKNHIYRHRHRRLQRLHRASAMRSCSALSSLSASSLPTSYISRRCCVSCTMIGCCHRPQVAAAPLVERSRSLQTHRHRDSASSRSTASRPSWMSPSSFQVPVSMSLLSRPLLAPQCLINWLTALVCTPSRWLVALH